MAVTAPPQTGGFRCLTEKALRAGLPPRIPMSWKIVDGAIVTGGERSHLFYSGDVLDHNFLNFEFSVDVKSQPGANSGVYIHTEFQEEGWPAKGYECQVLNSIIRSRTG